jgi:hypothetical protein
MNEQEHIDSGEAHLAAAEEAHHSLMMARDSGEVLDNSLRMYDDFQQTIRLAEIHFAAASAKALSRGGPYGGRKE